MHFKGEFPLLTKSTNNCSSTQLPFRAVSCHLWGQWGDAGLSIALGTWEPGEDPGWTLDRLRCCWWRERLQIPRNWGKPVPTLGSYHPGSGFLVREPRDLRYRDLDTWTTCQICNLLRLLRCGNCWGEFKSLATSLCYFPESSCLMLSFPQCNLMFLTSRPWPGSLGAGSFSLCTGE